MIPREPRDSTQPRPDHANANETEKNNLKNNFKKMIEVLEDDIKNPLNK